MRGLWGVLEAILAHLGPKRAVKSAPEAPTPAIPYFLGTVLGSKIFFFGLKNQQESFRSALRPIFWSVEKIPQHRMLLRSISHRFLMVLGRPGGSEHEDFAREWCKFLHFRLLQHKLALDPPKPSIFLPFWGPSWGPKSGMLAPRGQDVPPRGIF